MIHVIASLMGEEANRLVLAFQNAKGIWDEVLVNFDNISAEELGPQLQSLQMTRFERECGGRIDGKFVMGYSAAAYYYDEINGYDVNESKAKKLREAIKKSSCSLEVKGAADRSFREHF